MNTNEELQAHWKLTDNGTHEAWPEDLVWSVFHDMFELCTSQGQFTITDEHALDLVRASVERWLDRQQFGQYQRDGLGDSAEYSLRDIEFSSLPEALRWAMGQGKPRSSATQPTPPPAPKNRKHKHTEGQG
jgi:hypothetical protein